MRKRTVRTGLRFMIASLLLLLLGTFYSHQVNALFSLPVEGAFEFVKLAFFWSGILGASGIVICIFGLIRRSSGFEKFTLIPSFFILLFLLAVFCALFYRSLSLQPVNHPLKPGETLII